MSRRTLTLIVSAVLVVVLGVLAMVLPVPYVEMSPGPTFDVLGTDPSTGTPGQPGTQQAVISVGPGITTNHTSGGLRMVTVSVSSPNQEVNLFKSLADWLDDGVAVVPRENVYPDNQTQQQVQQQNTEDFAVSENTSTVVALCYLQDTQHAVQILPNGVGVMSLVANSPAANTLQVGDVVTAVNGTPVQPGTGSSCEERVSNQENAAAQLIKQHAPGSTVTLTVLRAGSTLQVPIVTTADKADNKQAFVGFQPGPAFTKDGSAPSIVTIALQDVGGPSAGLMFTLGVIDKLGNVDLTGGRVVAGTGEISPDGTVGQIGGIQMKTRAAKRDGATVFFVPAANCTEASQNPPPGLQLVKVSNVTDALHALDLIRNGQSPQAPHC